MTVHFETPRRGLEPPAPADTAVLLAEVREALECRLGQFLDSGVAESARLAPAAAPIVDQVRALTLRGGKRLRPAFVVAGVECIVPWRTLGPAVLDVCVAVELFQTYLLIHDDWMDGDAVRRGGPTVHVALSEAFGDAQRGAAAAVLAGDSASALAQSLLCGPSLHAEQAQRVMHAFVTLQQQVVIGQTLDLLGIGELTAVYDLKTGSYTVRGPLSLGIALAGGAPAVAATLTAYAEPLGVAFQLRDDILGAFADVGETGKGPLTDLEKGKRTAVFEGAMSLLVPADAAAIERLVGVAGADARVEARTLFALAGVRAVLEAEIEACGRRALAALAGAALRPTGKQLLEHLVYRVCERAH